MRIREGEKMNLQRKGPDHKALRFNSRGSGNPGEGVRWERHDLIYILMKTMAAAAGRRMDGKRHEWRLCSCPGKRC